MKKVILSNAFSIQMLSGNSNNISFKNITLEEAKTALAGGFQSAIGHLDTANVLSSMLGLNVQMNRCNVELLDDNLLIVAQLVGGRLPEGSNTLPEGFEFKFYKVENLNLDVKLERMKKKCCDDFSSDINTYYSGVDYGYNEALDDVKKAFC